MGKRTKLFEPSKETKKFERHLVNLRRVGDFMTRYADPDVSSGSPRLNTPRGQFPLSERAKTTHLNKGNVVTIPPLSLRQEALDETDLPLIQPIAPTREPNDGTRIGERVVAREAPPPAKRREAWRKKTVFFASGTKGRRVKKSHVRIRNRNLGTTESRRETDNLLETHPRLNGDEPASLVKTETFGARTPQDRVENPSPSRVGLATLDPCLVSFLVPDSFEAEQYRVLRHRVERLREELGRSCVVAVSSPSAGDGKTTTAMNLAGALAQAAGARVLLIDADLRRPAVLDRLGEQPIANRGLVKAILHPHSWLQNTAVRYPALNLSVLPAGQLTSSSYEIFQSTRFGALLEEARREYDYIILDTPPLVPISDCRLIERWVDKFFLVVAAHKTPRKLVKLGLSVIDNEKILGIVFNGDDPPSFGYEQYYGYSSRQTPRDTHLRSIS